MPGEMVLDASVVIKIFVDEEGSERARALAISGSRFCAPDFVAVEIASVFLKRFRRGQMLRSYAKAAFDRAISLFDELVPSQRLAARALEIAADHGTSAYDAMYVALAEAGGMRLATADLRLLQRVREARLAIEFWTP
jgi:predicted nucleic acid-binding protein